MTDQERPKTHSEHVLEITESQVATSKKRMADNLKKEAEEIDPRLMFLKLKKAFIEQIGQINAANVVANDAKYLADNNKRELKSLSDKMTTLQVIAMGKLEAYDRILQEMSTIINKLSAIKTPWYRKIWKKITGQN